MLVVNPTKVGNGERLRRRVARRCRAHGWEDPLVVQTTQDDFGEGMARWAVAQGAELVLSAGGDGTVMSVARGLAHTDVPLGVLPIGTGNLLARNLGLPLTLPEALEVALTGRSQHIDLGQTATGDSGGKSSGVQDSPAWKAGGGVTGQGFAVMAGIGFDAAMMADAPGRLKAAMGWPAYVVSGARHLRDRPMTVELRLDGGSPFTRTARGIIVGNVGTLQAGLRLLPDARPDDGLLDVVIMSPRRLRDWARVVVGLAVRRDGGERDMERFQVRRVELRTDRPQPSQLDGDPTGDVDVMLLEVDCGALLVRVPRSGSGRRA